MSLTKPASRQISDASTGMLRLEWDAFFRSVASRLSNVEAIGGLTPADGAIIVGDGSTWVAESGATARTSLGAQAADADLDALAGLSTTGLIARTGAGTASVRTITATTNGGLSVTNGDGVSGNPELALGSYLPSGTGAVARSVTGKLSEVVNVKDFGAVGDGATDDSAAINAAILHAATYSKGIVFVPAGTFLVSATPVFMRANIMLMGERVNSIIKQANSANLHAVVDFSSYYGGATATGATIRWLTIDGNRANNIGRLASGINEKRIVYYGNTSNVTIDDCIIQNGPGYGIHGSNQTGLRVTRNIVTNTENHSFFCVYTPGNFDADLCVENNYFDNSLLVDGVNHVLITGNKFVGTLIGDVSSPLTVNVSGTTVTWVSGPTFSGLRTGQLLIASNGTIQEDIVSVDSSTQLTIANSHSATGVLAMVGENDLLGVGGCKHVIITNNMMRNGASFGISLYGSTTQQLENCIVANNIMYRQGKYGFGLLGDGGGYSGIGAQNIQIIGNQAVNTVIGGLAGNPAGAGGLHHYFIASGGATMNRIILDSNFTQDNLGVAYSWLGLVGMADGTVFVGNGNHQIGCANPGISGGVSSITLGSSWGNTASTSSIISNGNSIMFTVTCNGTGIGANPQVTVNMAVNKTNQGLSSGQNAMYSAKMVAGSGTISHLYNENYSDGSSVVFRYYGTPVAGQTYQFQIT